MFLNGYWIKWSCFEETEWYVWKENKRPHFQLTSNPVDQEMCFC